MLKSRHQAMPLGKGEKALDFSLESLEGGKVSLKDVGGFKVLVFYKVTCPTCQLTLPFINKLYKKYGDRIAFLGIGQDSLKDLKIFKNKYELDFPQLSDTPKYPVSKSYDIRVVPTIYLLDENNEILFMEEGFVKRSIEELDGQIAQLLGEEPVGVFKGVHVPEFKAG